MRAADVFLAFASSTAVWLLCVTVTILIAIVVGIVPIILMILWDAIAASPVSDTTFNGVAALTILLVTLALTPTVSTVILRLSLRLSPLPVGHTSSSAPATTLWLSWLLVMAALVVSGSERITLAVAILIGAAGMGRAQHFRRQWSGYPRNPTVLFLRRFGRTADRLVSTAIRRAMPARTCLAFLVGSRQGAASWDPLVVGFDGMNTRALAQQHLLRYRASWRQAAVRIFHGFMLALLPAAIADSAGWSREARILVSVPAVTAWLCLAVRPLMDARSAEELTRTLAALHNARSEVHGNPMQPPVSEHAN